jgi:glucose-6-phosphate isomerase
MIYRHEFDHCLQPQSGRGGVSPGSLEAALTSLDGVLGGLDRGLPIFKLPDERGDLAVIQQAARKLERFDRLLVLGTGGSSLGARALTAIAPPTSRDRLVFLDNLDPRVVDEHLEAEGLKNAGILAVSKSGRTLETLATLLIVLERLDGDSAVSERLVAITEPAANPLRQIAIDHDAMVIDHDPELPGRFSVLSAVGLVPAAVAGLDPVEIRAGASAVVNHAFEAGKASAVAAAVGAALSIILEMAHGISTQVLMPYVHALAPFSAWHRQLWAESLGKDGKGSTPSPALGPVDQHSQLQLYLDGPADKMFTLITSDCEDEGPRLGVMAADYGLSFIEGRTIGDLVAAQQRATRETLIAAARPVREIRISQVGEEAMGALFMHFMLETVLAAGLSNVEPFGQPAVEDGKRRAVVMSAHHWDQEQAWKLIRTLGPWRGSHVAQRFGWHGVVDQIRRAVPFGHLDATDSHDPGSSLSDRT